MERKSDTQTIPSPLSNSQPYSKAKAVIGILLVIPWVILDMVLKKTDPSLGYAFGLFLGTIAGYLLAPGKPHTWVIVVLAATLAVTHFVFVPYYVCSAGN